MVLVHVSVWKGDLRNVTWLASSSSVIRKGVRGQCFLGERF